MPALSHLPSTPVPALPSNSNRAACRTASVLSRTGTPTVKSITVSERGHLLKAHSVSFWELAVDDAFLRCMCIGRVPCLQTTPSEYNAVAHIDYDIDYDTEATPSGYDAFADLVQMAVREDPSLANVASGSTQNLSPAVHICDKKTCTCFMKCKLSLSCNSTAYSDCELTYQAS